MDQQIERRFKNVSHSQTFRNIVNAFGLHKKTVLDIGCSYGEFLTHFGKLSLGVTIAPEEVAYGKEKNLNVRLGNIESPDFDLSEKFDVVFSNNLFEHLYSPHGFLLKIKKFLRPEGILILGVPCIPKLVTLLHLKKFRGSLAGAHINFFTRITLARTVERAGWKIVSLRGFHFANATLDRILDPIYPHFYAVAEPDPEFEYPEKRLKELQGYKNLS